MAEPTFTKHMASMHIIEEPLSPASPKSIKAMPVLSPKTKAQQSLSKKLEKREKSLKKFYF